MSFLLLQLYCPADGGAAAAAECTALVREAMRLRSQWGARPVIVLGDFNQDPLPPEAEYYLSQGFWDVGAGSGPTTCPGGGRQGRRIDRLYLSKEARSLVEGFRLRWDLGIATRAV